MIDELPEDLTLSQYISRKTNLLHDAGIFSENVMVRHLWERLDAQLTLATPMKQNDDTLKRFGKRVRQNEQAAKKVYDFK